MVNYLFIYILTCFQFSFILFYVFKLKSYEEYQAYLLSQQQQQLAPDLQYNYQSGYGMNTNGYVDPYGVATTTTTTTTPSYDYNSYPSSHYIQQPSQDKVTILS
jgi:hypothetical protein